MRFNKERERIFILDSLRGIAALIVVFHHVFKLNNDIFNSFFKENSFALIFLQWISSLNHPAVIFFFVLSGFVIYLSSKKLDFQKPKDLYSYFYKRFCRILPLYWIAIFFSFLLGIFVNKLDDKSFSSFTLIGNLLFLQTSDKIIPFWFEPYGKNGPLWSLAYEMFFYLFFPVFILLAKWFGAKAKRLTHQVEPIKLQLLLALVLSIVGIGLRQIIFIPYFAYISLFSVWFSGCYLAHIYLTKQKDSGFLIFYSLIMACCWFLGIIYNSTTLIVIAKAWIFILTGYIFLILINKDTWFFEKATKLINLAFLRIGEGSYAIYLLHYPLLYFFYIQYDLPLTVELFFLVLWCCIAIIIEKKTSKFQFFAFKKRYI